MKAVDGGGRDLPRGLAEAVRKVGKSWSTDSGRNRDVARGQERGGGRVGGAVGGFGVACTAIEALTEHLAVELGPGGVRAVCPRLEGVRQAGEDASVFGSRTFWNDLLAHDLVDELHLIGLVVLGTGMPLFDGPPPSSPRPVDTRTWDGSENVHVFGARFSWIAKRALKSTVCVLLQANPSGSSS